MEINDVKKSEIHLKILRFFHENQSSIDTPRGVATWVGEDRAKVKTALEDLVELKLLVADRAASMTGYSYTRDPKTISRVKKLLSGLR
jgi:hypothetical protein